MGFFARWLEVYGSWLLVGAGGLELAEVKGLKLPSESNCGTFGVFLHGDERLVLN